MVRALDKVNAMLMFSSAVYAFKRSAFCQSNVISPTLYMRFLSTTQTSMDDECPQHDPKVHRKLYQNCNHFIIRKYDGRIKKCRGATSPLRYRALRHLNLTSCTANSMSTVASKDRNVYWWPNVTFSTTSATRSVCVVVTPTSPCATSWSTSTVNWAKTMSYIWILWEHFRKGQ